VLQTSRCVLFKPVKYINIACELILKICPAKPSIQNSSVIKYDLSRQQDLHLGYPSRVFHFNMNQTGLWRPMLTNILNIAFFLAFALSAIVQYNDPDSLLWIIIYSAAACMCLGQYFKKPPAWLPPLLLAVSLAWIGLLVPNIAGQVSWGEIFESISMKTKAVEEAREIGGLAIIALWALVLLANARRSKSTGEE
jgi:Transmembrane family 220, helix